MADGINWGVPAVNYGTLKQGTFNPFAQLQQPQQGGQQGQGQQQPGQPGQPLNISAAANQPGWFDRLRGFLAGTNTPTQQPNPNVPVPSGAADPGVPGPGPVPPPGGSDYGPGPELNPYTMDNYLLDRYGTIGSNYNSTMEPRQAGGPVNPMMGAAPMMGGRPPIPYVQAGGGVPGYAGRLINPMAMGGPGPMPPMPAALPPGGPPMPGMTPAGTPMPGPPAGAFQGYGAPLMNRFNNPPPGYTAGNAIV